MAFTQTSHAGEDAVLRERCGLLDRSDRGRLALSGAGAAAFLSGQVTNDIEALTPGSGCYAALLTHKGKMLADLRVLAPDERVVLPVPAPPRLLLDTERVALQALFDDIRRHRIGHDVELHKLTVESAALSLIGPRAEEVAERAVDSQLQLAPEEHANRAAAIGGTPVLAIRTDLGIDLMCAAPDAPAVTDALASAGAEAVSMEAAEILRVETGRPRYGVDLDDSVIPQEAGLNERAVSFTKGCYVGQETVARLYYKGKPNRSLRGLRLSAAAAPGSELRAGERAVGRLASSVLSPRLGPIGLALVRREVSVGDVIEVGDHDTTAVVAELPFAG